MSSAGVEPGRVRSTEGGEEAPRLTDRDPDTHRHQRTGDETLADPSRAAPCAQARRERGERSFGASQRYEPAQSLDTRTVFRYLLRSRRLSERIPQRLADIRARHATPPV